MATFVGRQFFTDFGEFGLEACFCATEGFVLVAETFAELLGTLNFQLLRWLWKLFGRVVSAVGWPCPFAQSTLWLWNA